MASPLQRVQETIAATQRRPGPWHICLIVVAVLVALQGAWCVSLLVRHGLGLTGLNRPVGWGVLITNFVFWVGIAHSGTLISAILYLFRARFRTAIYRIAEAMTVFGLMTAGLFPVIHLGRPWYAYWLIPYPNQRHLWVNFRSPLLWDVVAVNSYLIVSSIFLTVGLIPDAAALRDATTGWRRRFYSLLACGWRGTDEEWRHYTRIYLFFAALATPLVVSVHSVVSWDFAVSILPGWHATLFPPYFVAGAILSGLSLVVVLLIPLRRVLGLHELITEWHFDRLARLVILTSLILTYSYVTEYALAWRARSADWDTLHYRATGDYAVLFWIMILCNSVLPLLFFARRARRSTPVLLVVCALINVGMWLERFVIIVTSLAHDRLSFNWGVYRPRLVEYGITAGAFGWFFIWLLLFVRFLPAVSISEMKEAAVEVPHDGD
ncbi:MAG: polysulfide reductase NrfD [Acidobacteriia bacterium]|nr:polysulfide reductase NrfD [Terriglobia bacterium]